MIRRMVTFFAIVGAIAITPTASGATTPVAVDAKVRCLPFGGIGLDLTLTNHGRRIVGVEDLHLLIEPVRVGGRQPGAVLFVFPAPGFDRIPSGESRTFRLTAGEPFEGEPALDLSGRRIVIEVQVWLRGAGHPVAKTLTAPSC